MRELVLVISDLYVAPETAGRELPAGIVLPGLQHVGRFGTRSKLGRGWRTWLSQWLTGRESGSTAAVAAAGISPAVPRAVPGAPPPAAPMVWMATPVHLVAGLTSLHLDRRSILRLASNDQSALAAEFARIFHDSGFHLQPLDSGDFLLFGPQLRLAESPEPARAMGASIADAQRADMADPTLRRLGSEIEMWLHENPVNAARDRRGEAPVTGLWLWGGGAAPQLGPAAAPGLQVGAPVDAVLRTGGPGAADIAFGRDAYLRGLWSTIGQNVLTLPPQLGAVFSYPHARRAALAIEVGPMLHANPTWAFFDAVTQIDRDFVAPAVDALRRGTLERLVILANDHQLTLRARDRYKVWRRMPPGLSGLQ